MKYLKYRQIFLNEKFESQFLTKTTGWLSKMGLNGKPFIDDLKKICEDNSIPLSTITDNFFDVNVNFNKAIKMRAPEDSVNHIWAIKFWFSATDGYKGFSVTPNRQGEKNESKSRKFQPFTSEEISILKKKAVDTDRGISFSKLMGVDLTKGELSIIDNNNLKTLKTGDIVAFYNINGDIYEDRDYDYSLKWAKIFKSHHRDGSFMSYVAYGKGLSGGYPGWNYDENGEEHESISELLYEDPNGKGIGPWILSESDGSLQNDNYKLHLYKKTDEDLHVVDNTVDKSDDPNKWNLSVSKESNTYRTRKIDYKEDGLSSDSIYKEDLDESNFAIVFHIDEFIPSMEGDLKDIRVKRHVNKLGATALMSEDEIKEINIKKRFDQLIDKLKLDANLKMDEMSNLKTILNKMTIDEFVIFRLYQQGFDFDIINTYYSFFEGIENERYNGYTLEKFIELNLEEIKNSYRKLINHYTSLIRRYKESYNIIMNSDNEKLKEIIKEIMNESKKLSNKIKSKEIVNLHDISIIIDKIRYIKNSSRNNLPYRVREILELFHNKGDIQYIINSLQGRYSEEDYNRSINSLKFINRVVDTI